MKSYICDQCEKSYKYNRDLTRHIKSIHEKKVIYECEKCKKNFTRIGNLQHHKKLVDCKYSITPAPSSSTTVIAPTTSTPSTTVTAPTTSTLSSTHREKQKNATTTPQKSVYTIYCSTCQRNVEKNHWMYHQRTNEHKRNSGIPTNGQFKLLSSGFKQRISSHYYENSNANELRVDHVLEEAHDGIVSLLEEKLIQNRAVKFNIELFAEYIKMSEEAAEIDIKSHQTKMKPLFDSSSINNILEDMYYDIFVKMSEFQERDSGWSLIKILHLEININKYEPLRGSNYICLPNILKNKKACINVQNNDEYCFKWALISALRPVNTPKRCSSYNIANIAADLIELVEVNIVLNFSGLSFPFCINDVKKFENQNHSISINVFGYDDELKKIVGPYYITNSEKIYHINLLLLQDDKDRSHYIWIKDISR